LRTVIIGPLKTGGRSYPWRVPVSFDGRSGHIALDQIRTVDEVRVVKLLGRLNDVAAASMLKVRGDLFAP